VQTATERKCELVAFTSRAPKPILQAVKSADIHPFSSVPLAELRRGECAQVAGLATAGSEHEPNGAEALLTRLRDLGFVAGARCEVIARMWPAGDPMAVRVGGSTLALRRAEAAAVRVQRLSEQAARGVSLEPKGAGAAIA
jgi:ferrous iron transport protein A